MKLKTFFITALFACGIFAVPAPAEDRNWPHTRIMPTHDWKWIRVANVSAGTALLEVHDFPWNESSPLTFLYCELTVTAFTQGSIFLDYTHTIAVKSCGGGDNDADACVVDADCPGDTCDVGTEKITIIGSSALQATGDLWLLWVSDSSTLTGWKSSAADVKISSPFLPQVGVKVAITGGGTNDYTVDCLYAR